MHGHGGHKGQKLHKHGKHGHRSKCPHPMGRHHENRRHVRIVRFPHPSGSASDTVRYREKAGVKPLPGDRAPGGRFRVDARLCKACGKCIKSCPAGAIAVNQETAVVDQKLCVGCGACVETCPTGALMLS